MTDYEQFKQLLNKWEVGYVEETYDCETHKNKLKYPHAKVIHLQEDSRKIVGYYNFYCNFYFDESGNFINIGIFE